MTKLRLVEVDNEVMRILKLIASKHIFSREVACSSQLIRGHKMSLRNGDTVVTPFL